MTRRFGSLFLSAALLNASFQAALLPLAGRALAQAAPPAASGDAAQGTVLYDAGQLDALLAPIALYPDQLLTQVLIAASFPLEVVEAARWVEDGRNRELRGPQLESALQPLSWDPSVKSLVPFPSVLTMMNSKLDWMQQIGYAFAVQQQDVMDSVQRLRAQAQAAGNLQTTTQQVVRREAQTIIIEPAQPQVIYVPAYNPTVVYGAWAYPAYPPVYFPPPPVYYPAGNAFATGVAFGVGFAVVGSLWGWCRPSWNHRNVYVNQTVYNNITINNYHRTTIVNNTWQNNGRPWGGYNRPPVGPVGAPLRPPPPNWRPPGPPGGHFQPGPHPMPVVQRPGQPGGQPGNWNTHGPNGGQGNWAGGHPGGNRPVPPPPPPGIARPNLPPPNVQRPATQPQARPTGQRPQQPNSTTTRPSTGRPSNGFTNGGGNPGGNPGGQTRPAPRPPSAERPNAERPSYERPSSERPTPRPAPQPGFNPPRPNIETPRPAPRPAPRPEYRPEPIARPAPAPRPEPMARPAPMPRPEPMARPAPAPRPERPNQGAHPRPN